jgi:hypothetical protein
LKKVGKFALARDPAPKPTKVASPNKSRFKYERSKDLTSAPLAAAATTTAPGASQKAKPIVRPGKLRWNKYVRQSIGGGETATKQPTTTKTLVPQQPPPQQRQQQQQQQEPLPISTEPPKLLSAAVSQLRKRSKRISAASELVRSHQGRKVAQPKQRAMQLLRLGGQLYARGGPKGRGRSLKLQNSGSIANKDASVSKKTSLPKPKPRPSTSAPTPAAAIASGSRSKPLSPTRFASKQVVNNQKKPMARLKGGRLVYCPVYCHTGRCPRRGRGCPLRHDPTKRAVCPLWLQGKCGLGATCPLQHQRRPELMPACVHYLQGRCTRSDCPYLHVDLPADAPHCAAFLRGYCAAGVKCASKHYTLKQIKEERKLVAGKAGKMKKKEKTQPAAGGGEDDVKPKKRKKRRGRYFDEISSDGEEKADEEAQGDVNSSESGGKDEDASLTSSSPSEEETTSEEASDEEELNRDNTGEEEEDQPSRKRSRRQTRASLPDFIGL